MVVNSFDQKVKPFFNLHSRRFEQIGVVYGCYNLSWWWAELEQLLFVMETTLHGGDRGGKHKIGLGRGLTQSEAKTLTIGGCPRWNSSNQQSSKWFKWQVQLAIWSRGELRIEVVHGVSWRRFQPKLKYLGVGWTVRSSRSMMHVRLAYCWWWAKVNLRKKK